MPKSKQLPPIQPLAQLIIPIRKQFQRLPQPQQDKLLVITLIAILGFAGWYEYNGGYRRLFAKNDGDPITLRTLPSLQEKPALYSHKAEVNSVAFSPDGQLLASSDDNGNIKLWKVGNKESLPNEKLKAGDDQNLVYTQELKAGEKEDIVWSLAFSPTGKTLASASEDGIVRLWKITKNESTILYELNHKSSVIDVAFSPTGKTLASASNDGTIKLWNVSKGTQILTLEAHKKTIYSLAFNSNGEIVASASQDGTVKLWKVSNGSLITTLQHSNEGAAKVVFSPSSSLKWSEHLASSSWDGTIKIWEIQPLNYKVGKPRIIETQNAIGSLAFSPDGKILASGSDDGTIKLWNTANGNQLRTLRSHPYEVYSLAFKSDGKALASASMDETVKLWEVKSRLYSGWTAPPTIRIW